MTLNTLKSFDTTGLERVKQLNYRMSKVIPYSIPGAGHGADPGFLTVNPQVT